MGFLWDAAAGRYRTAGGQFVREAAVRSALDTVLNAQAGHMRDLTQQLLDGTLPLSTWEIQQMQSVKAVHLVASSLAMGGWNTMTPADFGWVGQRVREQYQFLRQFAADLASGKQALNGTALARTEMYAQAARQTHRAAQQRLAQQRGMEQERNQLGAADHCSGCLTETARGWQPIGTLVPCGNRNCLSRCHCSLQYRMVPAA